jgi:hypothetical protein
MIQRQRQHAVGPRGAARQPTSLNPKGCRCCCCRRRYRPHGTGSAGETTATAYARSSSWMPLPPLTDSGCERSNKGGAKASNNSATEDDNVRNNSMRHTRKGQSVHDEPLPRARKPDDPGRLAVHGGSLHVKPGVGRCQRTAKLQQLLRPQTHATSGVRHTNVQPPVPGNQCGRSAKRRTHPQLIDVNIGGCGNQLRDSKLTGHSPLRGGVPNSFIRNFAMETCSQSSRAARSVRDSTEQQLQPQVPTTCLGH